MIRASLAAVAAALCACTHAAPAPPADSQPPSATPALSVAAAPVQAAAPPDAAVSTPPLAAVSSTAPVTKSTQPFDLVSALTVTGTDEPRRPMDPAVAADPAHLHFKDVPLLGALPGKRLVAAMGSMQPNLGVRCNYCHVDHDFASDDKPPKERARQMITMADRIDREFNSTARVACLTCHQGQPKPPPVQLHAPKPAVPESPLPPLSAADAKRPAREVYKNIKQLTNVAAGDLPDIMGGFTIALGARCERLCHVAGAWESDEKPEKQRARAMLELVASTAKDFPGHERTPVNCAMCHRGSTKPAP